PLAVTSMAIGDTGRGTVIFTPALGTSRLALSSTARLIKCPELGVAVAQTYVQLSRPLAGCQVTPPSTDTSTPPTTPPPTSAAVPVMVTVVPYWTVEPDIGNVMVEVGGVTSVDCEEATKPGCRVAGCTPISANRLRVACCIRISAGRLPLS